MEVFKYTIDWVVPYHNLRFHFLKIRFFDFPKLVDDLTVDFGLFFGFSRGKTKNEVSSKSLNFSLKAKNHIPGLQTQVPYAIFCSEPVLWQNTHLQRHILYDKAKFEKGPGRANNSVSLFLSPPGVNVRARTCCLTRGRFPLVYHLCLSHLGDRDTELFALFSIGEAPFQI